MLLFRSPTGILQVLVATAALALVSAQGNGNGNANGNGNGPPAFVANLPEKIQEKFQRDNLVKRDKLKDLPLQSVWHGGPNNNGAPVFLTTRLCGVRVVSLGGLKPVLAGFKTKTTCEKDGQEVTCPDPLVYTKEENDAKITVSMNPNNAEEVETVQGTELLLLSLSLLFHRRLLIFLLSVQHSGCSWMRRRNLCDGYPWFGHLHSRRRI